MVDLPTLQPPAAPSGSLWQTTLSNYDQQQKQNSGQIQNVNQTPVFTADQTRLQGQAGDLMTRILSGNTQGFGLPQAAHDAAWLDFNQYQAPNIGANFGSGSPVMNSARESLNLKLAGMSGQMAMPQALDAFKSAGAFAFNPVAHNSSTNMVGNTNTDTEGSRMENAINSGGLLGSLLRFGAGFGFPPIF